MGAAARATRKAEANRYSHHGMQVIIGATACLLKFSQDEGLQRFLLSTQQALLVETARLDGCWGVAMNSSQFLTHANPEYYAVGSAEESEFRYNTRGGDAFDRKYCEANALGKSLMIVRSWLADRGCLGTDVELKEAVNIVCQHMRVMQVPFDFSSEFEHLSPSL